MDGIMGGCDIGEGMRDALEEELGGSEVVFLDEAPALTLLLLPPLLPPLPTPPDGGLLRGRMSPREAPPQPPLELSARLPPNKLLLLRYAEDSSMSLLLDSMIPSLAISLVVAEMLVMCFDNTVSRLPPHSSMEGRSRRF